MSKETHENMYKVVDSSLLIMAHSIIENWTDPEAVKAAYKLKRMVYDFESRISKVYDYDEDEFCVLNHGDCWHTNLLFKTNKEGQPIDMLMVKKTLIIITIRGRSQTTSHFRGGTGVFERFRDDL